MAERTWECTIGATAELVKRFLPKKVAACLADNEIAIPIIHDRSLDKCQRIEWIIDIIPKEKILKIGNLEYLICNVVNLRFFQAIYEGRIHTLVREDNHKFNLFTTEQSDFDPIKQGSIMLVVLHK